MATILIVEDDRNLRLLTKARLEGLYTVASAERRFAHSGQEACCRKEA